MVLELQYISKQSAGLTETQILSPIPCVSGTVGLVSGLRIYISNKFPGGDDDDGDPAHTWQT